MRCYIKFDFWGEMMNKKIIIVVVVLLSAVLVYIGIQKYLQKEDVVVASVQVQQDEKLGDENVVIQKQGNGESCKSNGDCDSGNCAAVGLCKPCIKNCEGMFCQNDGQCCGGDSGKCINSYCSDGGNRCSCNSNDHCDSGNCYAGLCAPCLKIAMACSVDDQCCSGLSCLNGTCQKCLHFGMVCHLDSECCSELCVNGTCSCNKINCACASDATCNSGNCYAGLCQPCLGVGQMNWGRDAACCSGQMNRGLGTCCAENGDKDGGKSSNCCNGGSKDGKCCTSSGRYDGGDPGGCCNGSSGGVCQ